MARIPLFLLGAAIVLFCAGCPLEGLVEYEVVYDPNGGSGSTETSYHAPGVTKNLSPNGFIREGYLFEGWAASQEGAAKYADRSPVRDLSEPGKTFTLYARWKAVTYQIKYSANGGTGSMTDSIHLYDVEKKLSANTFTRPNYTFAGWAETPTGSVKYKNEEGVVNLSEVNGAVITLYAKWSGSTYRIEYNPNGGTGTMAASNHIYDEVRKLTANGFIRRGCVFTGWGESAEGPVVYANEESVSNLSGVNGAVITLYAQWRIITYHVKFNANGGTGSMADMTLRFNVAADLSDNVFTRPGYTFGGWAESSTGPVKYANKASVIDLSAIDGTVVTLYAKWNGITYSILYDANGGSGSMGASSHTYGTAKELNAGGFSRAGYAFAGWAERADKPVEYVNRQSVINLSQKQGDQVPLFAIWNPITYRITYNANSGTGSMAASDHSYDYAHPLSLNTFTRSGYVFAGWTGPNNIVIPDQANVVNLTATANAAITLTARWNTVAVGPGTPAAAPGNVTGLSTARSRYTVPGEDAAGRPFDKIEVSWQNPSNGISFIIYCGGKPYTTTGTSYTLTGLSPDTAYTITVRAVNANKIASSGVSKVVDKL